MSDYELIARRVDKATDNLAVRPVDLLKSIIHDIETGRANVDGILVLTAWRPPSPTPWECSTYRAGMTREAELAALAMAEHRAIQAWKEDL